MARSGPSSGGARAPPIAAPSGSMCRALIRMSAAQNGSRQAFLRCPRVLSLRAEVLSASPTPCGAGSRGSIGAAPYRGPDATRSPSEGDVMQRFCAAAASPRRVRPRRGITRGRARLSRYQRELKQSNPREISSQRSNIELTEKFVLIKFNYASIRSRSCDAPTRRDSGATRVRREPRRRTPAAEGITADVGPAPGLLGADPHSVGTWRSGCGNGAVRHCTVADRPRGGTARNGGAGGGPRGD